MLTLVLPTEYVEILEERQHVVFVESDQECRIINRVGRLGFPSLSLALVRPSQEPGGILFSFYEDDILPFLLRSLWKFYAHSFNIVFSAQLFQCSTALLCNCTTTYCTVPLLHSPPLTAPLARASMPDRLAIFWPAAYMPTWPWIHSLADSFSHYSGIPLSQCTNVPTAHCPLPHQLSVPLYFYPTAHCLINSLYCCTSIPLPTASSTLCTVVLLSHCLLLQQLSLPLYFYPTAHCLINSLYCCTSIPLSVVVFLGSFFHRLQYIL